MHTRTQATLTLMHHTLLRDLPTLTHLTPLSVAQGLAPTEPVLPLDEHNVKLLNAVHPRNWVDPTPDGTYNMVVIGAGAAGTHRTAH